MISGH
jgi:hypothetical protein